jgi:hypothetical protein
MDLKKNRVDRCTEDHSSPDTTLIDSTLAENDV